MSTWSCRSINSSTWGCKRKCITMNNSRTERRYFHIRNKNKPQLLHQLLSIISMKIHQRNPKRNPINLRTKINPRKLSPKSLRSPPRDRTRATTTRNGAWTIRDRWVRVSAIGLVKSPRIDTILSASNSMTYLRSPCHRKRRERCSKTSRTSKRWRKMLMKNHCE